jgi:tetratricopeptide (TPR) repeat protein
MTISTSSRWISALLAGFLSITPAIGRAEGPPGATPAASAKGEYERGIALYKAGNYVDAAQAFIVAYKLKPKAVILFNIGQAYRKMGALDGALAYYHRFLREAPASDRAKLEADTRKYIAELEDEIAEKQREERARADAERAARERRARETAEALAADRERIERERLERERAAAEHERLERERVERERATQSHPAIVDNSVKQEAPKKKTPVYKSAALWVPLSLVVVGVGLGVGLQGPAGPELGVRTVTFP